MTAPKVSVTFIVFTLIACSSISKAADPNSFPICRWTGEQSYPAVSGSYVVWQDYRSGYYNIFHNDPDNTGNVDGIGIDIRTKHQKFPAISGTRVVWEDFRTGTNSPNIYYCDLSSGSPTALNFIIGEQTYPAISGTNIVWQDVYSDAGDIYCNGNPAGICVRSGEQSYPAISGNMVVWQEIISGTDKDVYRYLLPSGPRTSVCSLVGSIQEKPAISGNYVVWQDNRNGDSDIYGRDIYGQEFEICKYAGREQINPAISDDIVVWEDYRNGLNNADIYGYRISTKEVFAICRSSGHQKNPAIDCNFVVWEDYRNGNADIYGAYIPEPAPLPVITVLDPNGGESLPAGSKHWIRWKNSGSISRVKIEDSNDNGLTFSVIDANVANNDNGESVYLWTIPADVNSEQCRIRISDKSAPDINDTSNNVFTIFQCDQSLTADLSGDCKVDFTDFALFSGQWLTCGNPHDQNWCP
ncbi:MAG: hypothetical protein WC770_01950 [Phycisphaerae bacterium]|jgi:beta propeller repeat protein